MPQYMLLIYGDPHWPRRTTAPRARPSSAAWMGYTQAMRDAGVFVAGDALHPAETASTVRVPERRARRHRRAVRRDQGDPRRLLPARPARPRRRARPGPSRRRTSPAASVEVRPVMQFA